VTTSSLPPLLQPWNAWLSLFPDDLAATLGQLLLRLQPLVGPLRRHAARTAIEPAGVGDIVRRGSYDRLLLSEWAYADAVPDEFIRRAAGGELLFTGPEPANSETSLRSVALFDAGPAQLGEPRLAHLAMFILLARRAELAGAEFQWGVLQQPGILQAQEGTAGVRRLLDARSHAAPDAAALDEWNTVLGAPPADCWLIGDPDSVGPAQAHSRVLVRRNWFDPQLDVELVQRRRSVKVILPLPAPDDSVRLLRRPFERIAAASLTNAGMHSLKRAPLFGNLREWLALGMVDGSVTVYRVPDRPAANPGRPRNQGKIASPQLVIAAGLSKKFFGTVTVRESALHFAGFPGPFFDKFSAPLPDPDFFHAVPGALRWMQAFHWLKRSGNDAAEEVLVLDKAGRLGAWTCDGVVKRAPSRTSFRLVSRDVIGAIQHGDRLLFAVASAGRTDIYAVAVDQPVREHLYPIMHPGQRFLFGETKDWRGGRGTYALQLDDHDWLVGDATGAAHLAVPDGDIVLGCARGAGATTPGLVVMDAARTRIMLLTAQARIPLVKSAERIAQASFDPTYGRLAWLGQKSGALIVRAIEAQDALLRVAPRGESDEA